MDSDFYRPILSANQIKPSVIDKWGSDLCEEGYVPLPKKLLRSIPRIFDGEHALQDLIILLGIADLISAKINKGISIRYLSFLVCMEEDKVLESLERLKENKILKMESIENEKYRFRPKLTGLMFKVAESLEELDSDTQSNEFFLNRETKSSP